MPKRRLGMLIVAAAAAGFGTFAVLVKFAYAAGANISTLLSVRFLLATVMLLAILKIRGQSLRIAPSLLFRLVGIGFVFYSGMSLLLANSLLYLSAPLAILLFYTYPLMVGVASCILGHEKTSLLKGLALLICLIGLFFILGASFSGINLIGLASIIGAAVMYASFIVAGGRVLKEVNSLVSTTYIFLTAGITFFLYGLASGDLIFNLPPEGWLIILAIAIFPTLLGILGLFVGISILGATTAAIISNLEPVVTVLLAALLLGETITLSQAAGGLMIIAGIILFQLKPDRGDAAADPALS